MKWRFLAGFSFALMLMGSSVAGTVAQDATPLAPGAASPIASPVAVAEVVPVDFFTVDRGDCARPTGTAAHPLGGDGYQNAGAGTLAPWGGGAEPNGTLGAVPCNTVRAFWRLELGQLARRSRDRGGVRNGFHREIMACGGSAEWCKKPIISGSTTACSSDCARLAFLAYRESRHSPRIRAAVGQDPYLGGPGIDRNMVCHPEATPFYPDLPRIRAGR